jgi:RNA polymerase sigma-70 factor (ECF subfamily)
VQDLALVMTEQQGGPPEVSELALLLRRAKEGDTAAFEQILVQHDRRVFRMALRLLGCVEDAQDATQEVCLKLHRHLRRFDDSRALAPWLYRVTVNTCRDLAARRKPHVPLESLDLASPAEQGMLRNREEQRQVLWMGLRRLPEKERAALVLRDIEDLPTAEVARILGSSEATVRSQVSSARLKIKRFVDGFRGRVK